MPSSEPFATTPEILSNVPSSNNKYVDLHVDDFFSTYLNTIVNRIYEATRCFNTTTNFFDIFFNRTADNILNNLIRFSPSLSENLGEKELLLK